MEGKTKAAVRLEMSAGQNTNVRIRKQDRTRHENATLLSRGPLVQIDYKN